MVKGVIKKFGRAYETTPDTFKMGIHYALGKEAAARFAGKIRVADACTGGGFMALCLAEVADKVVVVDTNETHLELVRTNARIAGSFSKFTFIQGDILSDEVVDALSGIEAMYADPEWALPGHKKGDHVTSIYDTNPPIDILLKQLERITPNIAIRLPKEINIGQLADFPTHEVEAAYLDGKPKAYTVYFGDLARGTGLTELRITTQK